MQFPGSSTGGNLGAAIGGPWTKTFSYDDFDRGAQHLIDQQFRRGLQPGRTTKAGTVMAASTHLSRSRSLASPRLRDPDGLDRFACSTVTRSLRSRIRHPRSRYRSFRTTRAFLDEYLISETGEVPFGGRDVELRRSVSHVSHGADRPRQERLARPVDDLRNHPQFANAGWQLAFMPISIRIGTNRPAIFYVGLGSALRTSRVKRFNPKPSRTPIPSDMRFKTSLKRQLQPASMF